MSPNDLVKMTGKLEILIRDNRGRIRTRKVVKNLVVTTGKNFIASRMVGATSAVMSHMAVGTNSTAPAAGDTTLNTELARVALSSGTASGNVATYTATFGAGTGTGALVEAGILNAGAAGDLLCRTTFSVVNKSASDSMTITWTVTIN
jgi:hypothetical protein